MSTNPYMPDVGPPAVIDMEMGNDPDLDGLQRTRDAATSIGLTPARFRDVAREAGLLPAARRQVLRHDVLVEEYLWSADQIAVVHETHVDRARRPRPRRRAA